MLCSVKSNCFLCCVVWFGYLFGFNFRKRLTIVYNNNTPLWKFWLWEWLVGLHQGYGWFCWQSIKHWNQFPTPPHLHNLFPLPSTSSVVFKNNLNTAKQTQITNHTCILFPIVGLHPSIIHIYMSSYTKNPHSICK